jgi:tetratricopeptide (TPR) repeat protein
MSLYQAAQFSLAEEAFRRLSVLEPADASHHYWVAESCYEQSHYIDSIAEFSRSLALSPDDEISQVRLVESVLASRNFSQAKASAAKALDRVKNLRLRERLSSVVQISSKGMPLPPDTSSRSQFGCETGRSK